MTGILDDDTHTFQDGALSRFLKMRKWLVLTGATLFLLDTSLLNFKAIATNFFVPNLSKDWFHFVVSATAVYQLAMAALVLAQLRKVYKQTLLDRLGYRGDANVFRVRGFEREITKTRAFIKLKEEAEAEAASKSESFGPLNPRPNFSEDIVRAMDEEHRLTTLVKGAKRETLWITLPEIVIDAMRIAPAVLFFVVALVAHGKLWPLPAEPFAMP